MKLLVLILWIVLTADILPKTPGFDLSPKDDPGGVIESVTPTPAGTVID